jgi:hypothetical protein
MSDAPDKGDTPIASIAADHGPYADDESENEGAAMRALVKRALSEDAILRNAPDLLRGVQRRIRKRSRGKFYADGWSTAQARLGYVLVAVMTVLLVAVVYVALGPMGVR